MTTTTRPADGSADGFGSVTTPAYRCVWLTGGVSHGNWSRTVQAMISPAQTGPRLSFRERRHNSAYLQQKRTCPQIRARPPCACSGWRERGKGKGPGQRLRTGVHPVGNGLGLRCLLGARALSRPNPPSIRMNAAAAPFGATPCHEGRWMLAPSSMTSPEPDKPAGPASEPWCWTEQQLTAVPGNVNRGACRSTTSRQSLITLSDSYGQPEVVGGYVVVQAGARRGPGVPGVRRRGAQQRQGRALRDSRPRS